MAKRKVVNPDKTFLAKKSDSELKTMQAEGITYFEKKDYQDGKDQMQKDVLKVLDEEIYNTELLKTLKKRMEAL